MKEFKGCKGAWVHHKPHGYQHSVGGWIQSEKGKVCDVTGLEVGRDAAFANAKLIAAAPDLLEALQAMVERIEYYARLKETGQPNIEDWAYTYNSGDMDEARAAISKALGEE
ncbi:hypothetical protein ACJJVG_05790 [Pseudocitrobacter faecalis]|uniref:hypothetical protein n=1 Tax=Pseudocitrobacter faecalis TaxID=1398493 RepID=UPI00389A27F4